MPVKKKATKRAVSKKTAKPAKAAKKKPVAKKPPVRVVKKRLPAPKPVAPPSIPPEFDEAIDEDNCLDLRSMTAKPKDYILRTRDGQFLHEVSDLVIANQLARALGVRIKVFKRTRDGEVLMSYHGPGKWD